MLIKRLCHIIILLCACQPVEQRHVPERVEVRQLVKPVIVEDKIRYGETLSAILKKHGIGPQVGQEIILSFNKLQDVRSLKAHEFYSVEKDSAGSFLRFCYRPTIEREYIVLPDSAGRMVSQVNTIPLEKVIRTLKGNMETTLYEAILALGETPELLVAFSDIFQWDVDFFIDPRPGDEFRIIYEACYLPKNYAAAQSERGRFVRYGRILAGQYVLQGEPLTAIYFDNSPGDDGYYSLSGESFQKTFLKSPLNYRRISSHFSYSRRHPILKIARPHYGIDFAAPAGTPVSATADGVIIEKGYDSGIGNFIKIRHRNSRFITLYGHLSRFATGIVEGKEVSQREVVGYVGTTGLSTGPHLHYTFYDGGRPINPMKIKNSSGDPIVPQNRERFEQTKLEMLAALQGIDEKDIPLVYHPAMLVHFNRYLIPEP